MVNNSISFCIIAIKCSLEFICKYAIMKGILPFAAAVLQVFHSCRQSVIQRYERFHLESFISERSRLDRCWSNSHLPPRPPSHWRSEHHPASWTGETATTFREKMNGTPAHNVLHCILFHIHKKSVLIHEIRREVAVSYVRVLLLLFLRHIGIVKKGFPILDRLVVIQTEFIPNKDQF